MRRELQKLEHAALVAQAREDALRVRAKRRELRRVGRAVERFELRAELVDLARVFLRLSLDGAEKRALRFELAKDVLRGRDPPRG